MTLPGRDVPAANLVKEIELVLEARIVSGPQDPIEITQHRLFHVEPFDNRLDHQIDIGQIGQIAGAIQMSQGLVSCLRRHSLFIHQPVISFANPLQAPIQSLRVHIYERHSIPRLTRDLRDAVTHRPRTDHANSLDCRHVLRSLQCPDDRARRPEMSLATLHAAVDKQA